MHSGGVWASHAGEFKPEDTKAGLGTAVAGPGVEQARFSSVLLFGSVHVEYMRMFWGDLGGGDIGQIAGFNTKNSSRYRVEGC